MLNSIIPTELYRILEAYGNISKIYEIRIRNNMPIVINYDGEFYELINKLNSNSILYADGRLIEYIICKATGASLYSYNEQIKHGYISCNGGIRIGLSGEVVLDDNKMIKTIKNFSSLCIRLPHEIKNSGLTAFNYIVGKNIRNTLIIGPPGSGKTTIIRDIARNLSNYKKINNILIIDERFEIGAEVDSKIEMDVGSFTDIISGCDKKYGFYEGIRSMRPDVIICDEIVTKDDIEAVDFAIKSGVKVIATTHAESHLDLKNKNGFEKLFNEKLFDRYIVLSTKNGMGTYEGIFDENFVPLYNC